MERRHSIRVQIPLVTEFFRFSHDIRICKEGWECLSLVTVVVDECVDKAGQRWRTRIWVCRKKCKGNIYSIMRGVNKPCGASAVDLTGVGGWNSFVVRIWNDSMEGE